MNYLPHLEKRGLRVWLLDGQLILWPKERLTSKIREVVRANKTSVIAEIEEELQQHQARMIAQAEEIEGRILALLDAGRISSRDADEKLTYIFRLTATTPAPFPPCSSCAEVLLWCFREETLVALAPEKNLPLLCYRCNPPKDGWVRFFLADEDAPQGAPAQPENLEHTGGWL